MLTSRSNTWTYYKITGIIQHLSFIISISIFTSTLLASLHFTVFNSQSNFESSLSSFFKTLNQLPNSINMQFHVLTTITLFIAATSAIPTTTPAVESTIEKRTCGTLTGTPLKVCQEACEAACVSREWIAHACQRQTDSSELDFDHCYSCCDFVQGCLHGWCKFSVDFHLFLSMLTFGSLWICKNVEFGFWIHSDVFLIDGKEQARQEVAGSIQTYKCKIFDAEILTTVFEHDYDTNYHTYLKWIFCLSIKSLKSVSRWIFSPAAESNLFLRLFSQAQYAIYSPIVIIDKT